MVPGSAGAADDAGHPPRAPGLRYRSGLAMLEVRVPTDSKDGQKMEIAMAGAIVVAVVAVLVQKRQQSKRKRK
ncbi:hypothetical protein [Arthrobacter sp.]|uniref:hypothetical protein n=1 Tax=Arthrobacter sp. TaxID=1667 RepID=UPI0026E0EDC3|nr:hypothetical protein [Arthrobacter sp.]MDO5753410.1 hypothetical protein [Arthrobacter sp.]